MVCQHAYLFLFCYKYLHQLYNNQIFVYSFILRFSLYGNNFY
ncbi:conserved domain protein [Bacteroides fluxus YIT 12057]|uniref:Conserved domain protein n=1 Tax=Bacteroides fluxus YIT 12057 TaxID=763034 RepID=F3PN71_9BACE|nr:conserved domain protein [Bacteroides fluxus YIT 12057]